MLGDASSLDQLRSLSDTEIVFKIPALRSKLLDKDSDGSLTQ